MGADGVEKVAIVADDDDHALVLIVHDEVFQPVDGLDIQIVGRLVQQYDVRVAKEGLSQQHFNLEPAVDIGHFVLMQLHRDPEAL